MDDYDTVSQTEIVFLRPQANRVSSAAKPSVIMQSKNLRVFSEGKNEGSGNKAEKRLDTSASHWTVSVSRAGKDDGSNMDGSLWTR